MAVSEKDTKLHPRVLASQRMGALSGGYVSFLGEIGTAKKRREKNVGPQDGAPKYRRSLKNVIVFGGKPKKSLSGKGEPVSPKLDIEEAFPSARRRVKMPQFDETEIENDQALDEFLEFITDQNDPTALETYVQKARKKYDEQVSSSNASD